MATNLFISYPDIPLRASTFTSTNAADTGYSLYDTISGSRAKIFRTASTGITTFNFDYDLGASVTASIDHVILARANLIKGNNNDAGNPTYTVKADSSTAYANTIIAATDISTANMKGPRSEDSISVISASTAYRYWRVSIGSSAAASLDYIPISKIYLGTGFDMGRDPLYSRVLQRDTQTDNNREPLYRIDMQWEGITDAKAQSFISSIANYADIHPVFLYTSSYHDILNEHRVIHCRIKTYTITPRKRPNTNTIKVIFEECV